MISYGHTPLPLARYDHHARNYLELAKLCRDASRPMQADLCRRTMRRAALDAVYFKAIADGELARGGLR